MTNEEKAKEIARECVYCLTDAENGALKMAEWKDKQFKEYLEKKKLEYEIERGTLRFGGDVIEKIIKELFGED